MTLDELKKFDGKDGRKCYIAYKGNIYDISDSDFWQNGVHMGKFEAGQDITGYIDTSPHGEKNIFKFPCIGKLSTDGSATTADDKKRKLQKLYAVLHPHPMMVHFPVALFITAFLLQISVMILSKKPISAILFDAQTVVFIFGSIMIIPAVLSGVASLYINYGWKTNKYLKRKITLSMVLLILAIIGDIAICRIQGRMIAMESLYSYLYCYTGINILTFIAVSGIGYYGGKLTWGGK